MRDVMSSARINYPRVFRDESISRSKHKRHAKRSRLIKRKECTKLFWSWWYGWSGRNKIFRCRRRCNVVIMELSTEEGNELLHLIRSACNGRVAASLSYNRNRRLLRLGNLFRTIRNSDHIWRCFKLRVVRLHILGLETRRKSMFLIASVHKQ